MSNSTLDRQSVSQQVAFCLTLGASGLALLLNCVLLGGLASSRERASGLLLLTVLEILLNFSQGGYLLHHRLLEGPERAAAGAAVYALQMLRNHWLLSVAVYRMLLIVRPQMAARPNQFPARRQAAILACTALLTLAEFCVPAALLLQPQANGTESLEAEHRMLLQYYLLFPVLGTVVPGLCMLLIAVKIAHSLRVHFAFHRCSKRTSKIIVLLAVAFIVCEFPFALANTTAAALILLRAPTVSEEQVKTLEEVAHWSWVVLPVDSCLNFFIFAKYSRSFQACLRSHASLCLEKSLLPRLRRHLRRRWQQRRRRRRRRQQRQQLAAGAWGYELQRFRLPQDRYG